MVCIKTCIVGLLKVNTKYRSLEWSTTGACYLTVRVFQIIIY